MHRGRWHRRDSEVVKGMAAGMIGGLVASWVMNQFQAGVAKAIRRLKQNGAQPASWKDQHQRPQETEDATMKVAKYVSKIVLHRELSSDQERKLGPFVHYGFGTIMGGLYGAVVEKMPNAKTGMGTCFGTVLFAGADEAALPALQIAKAPNQYPISVHASALAGHCVYGFTTEVVRRGVRALM